MLINVLSCYETVQCKKRKSCRVKNPIIIIYHELRSIQCICYQVKKEVYFFRERRFGRKISFHVSYLSFCYQFEYVINYCIRHHMHQLP